MTVVGGTQVIYACGQNGLKYVGYCSKGEWNIGPPECKPIRCGDPIVVENALLNVTGFELNSQVFYTCARNYRPLNSNSNSNVSVCLSTSKWSPVSLKCEGNLFLSLSLNFCQLRSFTFKCCGCLLAFGKKFDAR